MPEPLAHDAGGRCGLVGLAAAGLVLALSPAADATNRSSSLALTPGGRWLLAVNSDSDTVSLVSLPDLAVLAEFFVGDNPQAIAVSPQGDQAFVACRDDDTVAVVDLAGGRLAASVVVGREPGGVVAGADGRVYVALTGAHEVAVLAGDPLRVIARVATEPMPRGLALSTDGAHLYASHFLSGQLSVLDTAALSVERRIATGSDSSLARGFAVDETAGLIYLPHTRSNATNPALLFDGTVFPVVSVLDVNQGVPLPARRIALDIVDQPVSLPMEALLSADGRLFVAHAGSDDLTTLESATGRRLARAAMGSQPTGLVLSGDGATLYVHTSLAGKIAALDSATLAVRGEITVTDNPLPRDVLRGKVLFHTSALPAMARDRWIACSSCHPDGGVDARTWLFPDGPRSTPDLHGLRDTLPLHWSGDLDEPQDVESTIRRTQAGTGLVASGDDGCDPACDQGPPNAGRAPELDDLAAYLRSLHPRPSTYLRADGSLTEVAARGRVLFESAATGCATCHSPPLYTDRARHDVGTGRGLLERKGWEFDTPSLRSVYATAPYLHDGSAPTLSAVVSTANGADRHGRTSQLTAAEVVELVEFLRSLPLTDETVRCARDGDTLCLLGGRFRAELWWKPAADGGGERRASAAALSDRSGAVWFFDRNNPEVVVKGLDGRAVNGAFWVFSAPLTHLDYRLVVIDTDTGEERQYRNAPGGLCARADTSAFFDRPVGAASWSEQDCSPTVSQLCLHGRFQVQVEWADARTNTHGVGQATAHGDGAGVFTFFSRGIPELVVKILDGRAINGAFWVFLAPLTDLEVRVSVTDATTGAQVGYHLEAGDLCGAADVEAFRENDYE